MEILFNPHNEENEIIYSLTMTDLQRVAEDSLNRKLNVAEIAKVVDKLPDYISWYESIGYAIDEVCTNSHSKI
jgi:hypothetical protein